MGLVMVCPQCQAKVLLQCQFCLYCQSDLRDVPQDQRRYALGKPGPSTPSPTPEPEPEQTAGSIPVLESASVPQVASQPAPETKRIRRPYVSRFAGSPSAATQPAAVKSGKAAVSKPDSKKAKKPRTAANKKKK